MAEQIPKKKSRRLRPAPETVRERAERNVTGKPKRRLRVKLPFLAPVGRILAKFGRLRVWKPLAFVVRLLGKLLVPPYIRNSWRELRHVTWPGRKQTLQLTGAVIIFSLAFGIVVAVFDYGLDKLFKQVILR